MEGVSRKERELCQDLQKTTDQYHDSISMLIIDHLLDQN